MKKKKLVPNWPKKEKKVSQKHYEKTNSCISHCSFSKKGKKNKNHSTHLIFYWQKFMRQTFFWPNVSINSVSD